jgi:hypothetical protein
MRIQESEYRIKTIAWLFWPLAPVFSCFVVPAPGMAVSKFIGVRRNRRRGNEGNESFE